MLPQMPKIPLARYLKQTVSQVSPVTLDGATATERPYTPTDELETWLVRDQAVMTIDVTTDETVTITSDHSANLVINVAPHVTTTIIERWRSTDDVTGVFVHVNIGTGAHVTYINDDAIAAQTLVLKREAVVEADAQLVWTIAGFNVATGAALLLTRLAGDGATATVNVGVLATAKMHLGYTTRIENQARHTTGHINQRGVIIDQAHLVFNGIGHIQKGARGSDNQQENRVLMLSDDARGDANPLLLIDENDVTAGHAASVARVDQGQMYYLMSRGLDEVTASRLVIRGFLESGFEAIKDPELKQALFDRIDRGLAHEMA
ncbi:SufD family Fe-S cluster assembly protein [Lacticaseibacillus saniviri]|uniref:Fe-S cluster assembly ABC-type transport system, permease component n=1 Tax=Lacticaseibacillus saniviri JCM 17471 = DSM 24301 TaxID=1293598 RepID=A0A0R2N1U8_9LACO|nr:SufD family Fe-S cluster assembly protein [Lacticaseibacillus saniviri]KRO18459.1 Fe-S cluster assembly ABC-type transport system, permease component [Lacticaseibacillus saniviri JCM 17471 = DSM 24301]